LRIIFLDFDGPIIPIQSHETRRAPMEKAWPPCITALNRITAETGAKIVVSSSWRGGGLREMQHLLKAWGVTGDVIAVTPYCYVQKHGYNHAVQRGIEIQAYLDLTRNVESFVILDDDRDMVHLMPFLIQTPFEVGLTEADADRAIGMLRTRNWPLITAEA
jgi:hypothetical protein